APNQGWLEVYAEQLRHLQQGLVELNSLLASNLGPLNDVARKVDLPIIVVPGDAAGPKSSPTAAEYAYGPDSSPQPGVPQGTVTKHKWESTMFPGTVRDWWLYVPAQYDPKKPACVMVFQDGGSYQDPKRDFRVPVVFDNLIHKGEMPVTIGI